MSLFGMPTFQNYIGILAHQDTSTRFFLSAFTSILSTLSLSIEGIQICADNDRQIYSLAEGYTTAVLCSKTVLKSFFMLWIVRFEASRLIDLGSQFEAHLFRRTDQISRFKALSHNRLSFRIKWNYWEIALCYNSY